MRRSSARVLEVRVPSKNLWAVVQRIQQVPRENKFEDLYVRVWNLFGNLLQKIVNYIFLGASASNGKCGDFHILVALCLAASHLDR